MRGSDGKLCFNRKARGRVWKDCMENIMNEENDWDYNVEVDAVEGPVVCVCREDVLQALYEIRKKTWTFTSIIGWLKYVRDLDGFGMLADWSVSIVVPIFKERVISETVAAMNL